MTKSLGRNDRCHCGSGRKYKHCCLTKDETAEREARIKAEEKAEKEAARKAKKAKKAGQSEEEPQEAAEAQPQRPKPASHQPWKRSSLNTHGYTKFRPPRKVGQ